MSNLQNNIKFSGLSDLTPLEIDILNKIIEKEYPKIQRMLKEDSELKVNIKTSKKGKGKRYNVSMLLETTSSNLSTKSKDTELSGDWDLKKAVHKALTHLEAEVKHKFKTDQEKWKGKRSFRDFIKEKFS